MSLSLRTFLTPPFLPSASVEISHTSKLCPIHLPSTDSVLVTTCLFFFPTIGLQLACEWRASSIVNSSFAPSMTSRNKEVYLEACPRFSSPCLSQCSYEVEQEELNSDDGNGILAVPSQPPEGPGNQSRRDKWIRESSKPADWHIPSIKEKWVRAELPVGATCCFIPKTQQNLCHVSFQLTLAEYTTDEWTDRMKKTWLPIPFCRDSTQLHDPTWAVQELDKWHCVLRYQCALVIMYTRRGHTNLHVWLSSISPPAP